MEPKSRFDRDLDVWEPTQGTSRFEHLDREITVLTKLLCDGAELKASSKEGCIVLQMGSYQGTFPSFQVGVTILGEAVMSDTWAVESSPSKCPGETPIDRFLLERGRIEVSSLGGRLHAVLSRSLPERTFTDKGKQHRVYRKGIRKAVGTDLFVVLADALAAQEEVVEGSLMSTP